MLGGSLIHSQTSLNYIGSGSTVLDRLFFLSPLNIESHRFLLVSHIPFSVSVLLLTLSLVVKWPPQPR